MKCVLLLITICVAFANAQFYYDKHGESRGAYKDCLEYSKLVGLAERFNGPILVKKPVEGVKPRKNLEKIPENKIQRTFNVNRDTLNKEKWLEVEKNEIVKICVDAPVVAWETSLKAIISSDLCLAFQTPTLIGVETLNVFFSDADSSKKINLAVGMKYLDFKNEEVLLGYYEHDEKMRLLLENVGMLNGISMGESDPERLRSFTGTYLVDKYPVTKCEFTQIMWDSIPANPKSRISYTKQWISRKTMSERNKNCVTQDSAAETVSLYLAMKYANARSAREGLRPYYKFEFTDLDDWEILSKGKYVIGYYDFITHDQGYIQVSIDSSSDGYRLPYYDEWMMLARGGDKKNKAPWGDTTATYEEVSKYARFTTEKSILISDRVGQKKPNGYGLYDVFGLVEEHVLFESYNPFPAHRGLPSCKKGGQYQIEAEECLSFSNGFHNPCWKQYNYGYSEIGPMPAGFRLIRNIGNNAKWTEIKTVGKE